jgi:hypothetical protein
MRNTFHFYSDPAHGWLKVTTDDLAAVGLTLADFSPYSYRKGDEIFLEEDMDESLFLAAYNAKHGHMPDIVCHALNGESLIRTYARLPDSGATFADRCAKMASFRSVEA